MQDQANELKSKVNAMSTRVKEASGVRDSRKDLNSKLNVRIGDATATLLEMERQASGNTGAPPIPAAAATSSSHTAASPACNQQYVHTSCSSHSVAQCHALTAMHLDSAGHFDSGDVQSHRVYDDVAACHMKKANEAPAPAVSGAGLTWFDPLIPIRPTVQRPIHSFAQQSALSADEAVADLVHMELPSDGSISCAAHHSKQEREWDIEATQSYVQQFSSGIDGYLDASCAPVRSEDVCWYLQTPFNVAQGSQLSFSSSLSNLSCCASIFMHLSGTMLESTFIDKLLQQQSGHVSSKAAALDEAVMKPSCPLSSGPEKMNVMQMLDKIIGLTMAPPKGMLGMHAKYTSSQVTRFGVFHVIACGQFRCISHAQVSCSGTKQPLREYASSSWRPVACMQARVARGRASCWRLGCLTCSATSASGTTICWRPTIGWMCALHLLCTCITSHRY